MFKYMILLLLVVIAGLNVPGCQIHIDNVKIPAGGKDLVEFVNRYQAEVDSLEKELSDAKEYRDKLMDMAKNTDGYFAKSEIMSKVSRANSHVEFTQWKIRSSKEKLAEASSRLESTKTQGE